MTPPREGGGLPVPYYADGLVTIYHGDCADVLPALADELFDIVVTSPPYNMGLVPGGNGRGMYRPGASNKAGRFRDGYEAEGDDGLDQHDYDTFHRRMLGEMWRVCRLGVFYNHRPRVEHGQLRDPLSGDYGKGPILRQRIIWDRGTGIDVTLRGFCTRGEYVLLFAKPAFTLASHSASGMGDVWRLGMEHDSAHPAPFPLSLPTRCIEATAAQSVLDPFCGSGTTLRAAANAGIRAVGIDASERYCEMAARRLDQGAFSFGGGDVTPPTEGGVHPLCVGREQTGVCGVCGDPLGGNPNYWFSLITSLERCHAKCNGFHEPRHHPTEVDA